MTKNHTGNKPVFILPATTRVPLRATHSEQKQPPHVRLLATIREYKIFRNGAVFRLFFELVVCAPGYERWEIIDNNDVHLEPRQGTFKGLLFARRLSCSRSTVWRQMRMLKKAGFVKRILKHQHSLYSLTGKGLPDLSCFTGETTQIPLQIPPPATPQRAQVIESNLILNRIDYLRAQAKIFGKIPSPCARLDSGLTDQVRTWTIAGVCVINKEGCRVAENFCIPHLKKIFAQLQGRAIKTPKAYIQKTVGEYFLERR